MNEFEAQKIYDSLSNEELAPLKEKPRSYYLKKLKSDSLTTEEQAFMIVKNPVKKALQNSPNFQKLIKTSLLESTITKLDKELPEGKGLLTVDRNEINSMLSESKREKEKQEENKFSRMYQVALWTLISTIIGVFIGVIALIVALIS